MLGVVGPLPPQGIGRCSGAEDPWPRDHSCERNEGRGFERVGGQLSDDEEDHSLNTHYGTVIWSIRTPSQRSTQSNQWSPHSSVCKNICSLFRSKHPLQEAMHGPPSTLVKNYTMDALARLFP